MDGAREREWPLAAPSCFGRVVMALGYTPVPPDTSAAEG